MSMIERAAKALEDMPYPYATVWGDEADEPRTPTLGEFYRSTYQGCNADELFPAAVRAVLQAIREPSEAMTSAGIIERHDACVPEAWSLATANIYRAMIDAAMRED